MALLLGLMMILAPAMGVPSEEMLQDTLKSIIVSTMTMGILAVFLWQLRSSRDSLYLWHRVLWLPLGLVGYALCSTVWSHAYLGAVEAIRWWVFAVILWLGMNAVADDHEDLILWGVHWGVTIASIWTAWQFWGNLSFFAQGPNPSSTFVNRNFFAEYAVCALPYSVYLALKVRDYRETLSVSVCVAFNICALMMTGTRSALLALALLCCLAPFVVRGFWAHWAVAQWGRTKNVFVLLCAMLTLITLGSLPTTNSALLAEFGPVTALQRAYGRMTSIGTSAEYTSGSFSIRSGMWVATARMINAHPLMGVGAGAWEIEIPKYQDPRSPNETDYYAHNEFLQLVSEYGLAGATFLLGLAYYLARVAVSVWSRQGQFNPTDCMLRAASFGSILMLLVVSNAGFPWRMASTGALFALSLSLLAATDARVRIDARTFRFQVFGKTMLRLGLTIAVVSFIFATYLSVRAAMAEHYLVRGLKLALTVERSSNPYSSRWNATKVNVQELVKRGIELNPHYRKLTPAIGDSLARWGDWKTALFVWESVLASRPHVISMISNSARAHLELGNVPKALQYLEQAKSLQPESPTVVALEVDILLQGGQVATARRRIESFLEKHPLNGTLYQAALRAGIAQPFLQEKLDRLQ